jgi:hypothetical protein
VTSGPPTGQPGRQSEPSRESTPNQLNAASSKKHPSRISTAIVTTTPDADNSILRSPAVKHKRIVMDDS